MGAASRPELTQRPDRWRRHQLWLPAQRRPLLAARNAEARAALAAIYGTFTEGFTTPNLVDAGALLNTVACLRRSSPNHPG